jgi:hypothetical protein
MDSENKIEEPVAEPIIKVEPAKEEPTEEQADEEPTEPVSDNEDVDHASVWEDVKGIINDKVISKHKAELQKVKDAYEQKIKNNKYSGSLLNIGRSYLPKQ